jgi:phospholipid/cholesterol/gamma-HCH transport system permease protein
LGGLTALDDVGALWLVGKTAGLRAVEVPPQFDVLLRQAEHAWAVGNATPHKIDWLWPVIQLGHGGLHFFDHLRFGITLLGQVLIDVARSLRWPREFPLRELSANIFRSGVTALPVTMLVGFLVGVVLTYLSALQLKSYGADLLVINIVSVGVARELGPMLASIIAAGRSGSTMTAQLGVMRVTEEIEALQVMGISVTGRLVLPKLLGLAIAMPLVSFATDVAALGGGMLAAKVVLGIEFGAFLEALPRVLDVAHFWIGIGKSVVFGFAVAFVACHYGLRIRPNTESLGTGVTRSVVAAITSVILLDAIFAILLRNVP